MFFAAEIAEGSITDSTCPSAKPKALYASPAQRAQAHGRHRPPIALGEQGQRLGFQIGEFALVEAEAPQRMPWAPAAWGFAGSPR